MVLFKSYKIEVAKYGMLTLTVHGMKIRLTNIKGISGNHQWSNKIMICHLFELMNILYKMTDWIKKKTREWRIKQMFIHFRIQLKFKEK